MLDLADFTVGMYLIQACMSNQLPFVPTSLPPGLYEQAAGVTAHGTGSSGMQSASLGGAFPGRAPVAAQYTGAGVGGTPLTQQFTGSTQLSQQFTGSKPAPPLPSRHAPAASPFGVPAPAPAQLPWDITAADKANADRFFDGLDTHKQGFIEGEAAVGFLTQSGLPGDVLARVWDLADIDDDGRLRPDEFAVAMHLIQGALAGKELPAALPPSLVPPAFRAQQQQQAPPAAQAYSDTMRDLLWDDAPPPSAQAPLQPQSTGAMLQPQSTGAMALSPPRPPPPAIPMRSPAPPQPSFAQSAFTSPAPAVNDPFGNNSSCEP
jgi:epidermal growth factor receptor substrate 15